MEKSCKCLCYGCNRIHTYLLSESKVTLMNKDGTSEREVACSNCGAKSLLHSWGFKTQEKKWHNEDD